MSGPSDMMMVDEETYWQQHGGAWKALDLERADKIKFQTQFDQNVCKCLAMIPHFWLCCPCLCAYYPNIKKNVRALVLNEHVALTEDGITHRVDEHRSGCGFNFQTKGTKLKTVPYDRIQDVSVVEPAGSSGPICCMTKNILYKVVIETAAQAGPQAKPELTLKGIQQPHELRKALFALKRGLPLDEALAHLNQPGYAAPSFHNIQGGAAAVPPAYPVLGDGLGDGKPATGAMMAADPELKRMLREQNQLLQTNNALLQSIDTSLKGPSAPKW